MPSRRKFPVYWAKTAAQDLDAIIEYLCAEDVGRAQRVLDELRRSASGLEILPERGRVVPELREHGILIYRELVPAPWRILYRIGDRRVLILAVFDSRRNLEDLLLQRFLA